MEKIEFELNIPSGSMVFADWLPGFEILGSFDLNTTEGLIKRTMAMARIGCAHGFVGNSCPGVYRVSSKKLIVANVPIDEDTDEPMHVPGEHLGSIITDLWWYSFADAEEFKRRCGVQTTEYPQIEVRPGVYTFSHRFPKIQRRKQVIVYAKITWVRKPDPIKDYLEEFRKRNFTAGQVISHKIKQYPNLYSGKDAIMKAANHIFCILGNGGGWHPNGFVQSDPDMPRGIRGVRIPRFDKPFHWYPLSQESSLVKAADSVIWLNPTFAKLAKNIARCIAKHGSIGHHPSKSIAARCLKKLEVRYPAK